jgi:cupin 2 domain-containing protein
MLTNLLQGIPAPGPDEVVEALLRTPHCRVERIVSWGQASPPGFWYDQDEHEWVLVLRGRSRLRLEGRDQLLDLRAGDTLDIPPHCRHRVEWTDPSQPTIWLAVFCR